MNLKDKENQKKFLEIVSYVEEMSKEFPNITLIYKHKYEVEILIGKETDSGLYLCNNGILLFVAMRGVGAREFCGEWYNLEETVWFDVEAIKELIVFVRDSKYFHER